MAKEYQYNGFTYKEKKLDNKIMCDIIHNKPKPKSIYKFYGISKYSIEALKEGYLYASHPFELNDSLDSSVFLISSKERIDFSYYKNLFKDAFNSEKELIDFYKQDNIEGHYSHGYIKTFWELISNIFGIISLTGIDKNELMWPHYTNEKGFQLKFNTEKLEASIKEKAGNEYVSGLFPMNYTKKLNLIDFSNFENHIIPFYYATNIKSIKWLYENEWRFLISKPYMGVPYSKSGLSTEKDFEGIKGNRKAFYDRNLVDEITLGNNFFTGREFKIQRQSDEIMIVEPLKTENNWNYNYHVDLLNYMYNNLSDKIYHSGKKYELDENKEPYLIRTKERLEIELIDDNRYKLIRTGDFY